VAGNIGHIQPSPGRPVLLADRLTAAASPLAAFAGLTVGLLVLRMNRQRASSRSAFPGRLLPFRGYAGPGAASDSADGNDVPNGPGAPRASLNGLTRAGPVVPEDARLLKDAAVIYEAAAARGERLSQRSLVRTLRGQGHRFPNECMRDWA
jgi:hypothetical protein